MSARADVATTTACWLSISGQGIHLPPLLPPLLAAAHLVSTANALQPSWELMQKASWRCCSHVPLMGPRAALPGVPVVRRAAACRAGAGAACRAGAVLLALVIMPALPAVTPCSTDGIMNGGETDVDCGGGVCPPCINKRFCHENSDCKSRTCLGSDCIGGWCKKGECSNPVRQLSRNTSAAAVSCPLPEIPAWPLNLPIHTPVPELGQCLGLPLNPRRRGALVIMWFSHACCRS